MNRSDFTANWHTHNFRCRHARGDFADYARAAVGAGVAVLGVSDHCPTPDDRDIGVRMFHSDLQGYIDGFRASRDSVPGVEMIESGLYAFIAHPDLIGCFCDRWLPECEQAARKIAATARDCGIPLEINTSGYNKPPKEDAGTGERRAQYPWEPFWKAVAEEGATAIVNTDAHLPESIVQRLDDALALCDRCGIAPATFTGVKGNRLVGQSVRNGIDTAVTVGGATPLSRRERRP